MIKGVYINIPTKDLQKSTRFFTDMGFKMDERFSDSNASMIVIDENYYIMILTEEFFRRFTKKTIADESTVETLIALEVPDKDTVDRIVDRALELGAGSPPQSDPMDFMYTRSFYDTDGHHWEFFWMDNDFDPQNPV
ncbi:VOC family protein [Youngiibacter multivorans]|uniref:Lactoylglutathione lyase n=1 Tax=Youngiibacter multivorans TaxID=937251 RepID=A0ABS4G2F4_9CLOT|nr:VOC family protein [Youngiibacter multivorans]MBP1918728.1 putative lactoylglutathione lyase [Youngiibacter multivorans]